MLLATDYSALDRVAKVILVAKSRFRLGTLLGFRHHALDLVLLIISFSCTICELLSVKIRNVDSYTLLYISTRMVRTVHDLFGFHRS